MPNSEDDRSVSGKAPDGEVVPVGLAKYNPFRRFDKRLAEELKTQRRPLTLGLICTAIASAQAGLGALIIKYATDAISELVKASKLHGIARIAGQDHGMYGVERACVLVLLLYGTRYWFARGQTYYLSEAANRLAMTLRIRMLEKLMRLPVSYYNDRRAGAIQSVLTNDVNVYQNAVAILRDSVSGPIVVAVSFASVLYFQWKLSVIAIVLLPVMGAVIQRNAKKMRLTQRGVQEDLSSVSATTLELLQGMRVIKAFGAERLVLADYDRLVHRSFASQMRAVNLTAALAPLVELIGASGVALLIYICGVLAKSGSMTFGDVLGIVFAMDRINVGMKSFGSFSNTYAMVSAASARIYDEVLDVSEGHESSTGNILSDPKGRIEFENVSFCYPDGTTALRGVSFLIEPGTSLALVGPSGAGKSTIADLLLRFYEPTSGRILFDGRDIRELNISWFRSQIGVVPQQTFLFAGSIEENVRLGAPEASEEDLTTALEQAHATEFTAEMKDRSTPELGERGVKLSGGQMQRIAIARALIRKPTVLLLDEATSALDATSEHAVTEALSQIMTTRTTLFIAHRLTTAARADRILVLSRGEAVEHGSHAELMESHGVYAGLFRAFSGGILE